MYKGQPHHSMTSISIKESHFSNKEALMEYVDFSTTLNDTPDPALVDESIYYIVVIGIKPDNDSTTVIPLYIAYAKDGNLYPVVGCKEAEETFYKEIEEKKQEYWLACKDSIT